MGICKVTVGFYLVMLMFLVVCGIGSAFGQEGEGEEPEQTVTVSNVKTEPQETCLKVTYDLATSDDEPVYISGRFSTDGGETYTGYINTVTGDVNKDVAPGTGCCFVWNFAKDGVTSAIEQVCVEVQGGMHPGMEREFGGIICCWIPAGSFKMGRYPGEQESTSMGEEPLHEVTFAEGFWISKYEITQGQWQAVMGNNPASMHGVGVNYPVYNVSWEDIRGTNGFLEKFNAAHPGHGIRLPSEAEWEYACRAGTTTRFYWGDDSDYTACNDYAWSLQNNTPGGAKETGLKLPNAWGLHDMSGNVWEWCEDDWHGSYRGAPDDGSAWVVSPRSSYRVSRGASWFDGFWDLRLAKRFFIYPQGRGFFNGFRVVVPASFSKSTPGVMMAVAWMPPQKTM